MSSLSGDVHTQHCALQLPDQHSANHISCLGRTIHLSLGQRHSTGPRWTQLAIWLCVDGDLLYLVILLCLLTGLTLVKVLLTRSTDSLPEDLTAPLVTASSLDSPVAPDLLLHNDEEALVGPSSL